MLAQSTPQKEKKKKEKKKKDIGGGVYGISSTGEERITAHGRKHMAIETKNNCSGDDEL